MQNLFSVFIYLFIYCTNRDILFWQILCTIFWFLPVSVFSTILIPSKFERIPSFSFDVIRGQSLTSQNPYTRRLWAVARILASLITLYFETQTYNSIQFVTTNSSDSTLWCTSFLSKTLKMTRVYILKNTDGFSSI